MITGFFLSLLYILVSFFLGILPEIEAPAALLNSITLVWSYLNAFAWLIPVGTLVSVLTIAFSFHAALFAYDYSLKVYHMIRG